MKNLSLFLLVPLFACSDKATDSATDSESCHVVTTTDDTSDMELYMDFTPEDLTISVGDCVKFVMSSTHNAVEVSQDTYNSGGTTPLDGGFEVTYGETAEITFDVAGTHYYVCQPHAGLDMIGTITVE